MSSAVFLPLLLCLGICLIPVWLLRQGAAHRQDYCVSPRYIPPEAIRNSSIAHSLRMAVLGPVLIAGAVGNFWPVILGASCFGLGLYLIYLLRQPIFAFLTEALDDGRSITVHAFIARQHGNDPRVRVFAASLTLLVLVAMLACEAFAFSGFFKLIFGNDTVARALAFGILLLAALYAVPAGHPGVIYSGQLQLGAIFVGLFGAAALLLYLHVSALSPLPPYAAFAIGFAAVCCLAILIYRRSRYIETGAISLNSRAAKLLSKFGKALNPLISIFVVLIIVLAGMDFAASGFPMPGAGLQSGSGLSLPVLAALILLPLFYPLADVVHWQRLAAIAKNREAYQDDTARWLKALRGIFRIYAVEIPMLWLFIAGLGAIGAAALVLADGAEILPALVQEAAAGDNPIAAIAFSLLLVAVAAIGLSTMASCFSAGLCTIRYDILPADMESSASSRAGRVFFMAVVIALIVATEALPMRFTDTSFVALVFALSAPLLAFAPLLLGPLLTDHGTTPGAALAVLALGAASTVGALTAYAASGNENWLWAAAPACLGAGCLVLAVTRFYQGSRIR
jgi:hypothetical protein